MRRPADGIRDRSRLRPPARAGPFGLLDGALGAGKDEPAGGAALPAAASWSPTMEIPRQIDRGPDGTGLHETMDDNRREI